MAQRFTARQRIRARSQFQRVYNHGQKVHGRFMTLFILPVAGGVGRLGIAATRRFGGAVQRNLAKRRVREVFRTTQGLAAGLDIVVVPKREFFEAGPGGLEADYRAALKRGTRAVARSGVGDDRR